MFIVGIYCRLLLLLFCLFGLIVVAVDWFGCYDACLFCLLRLVICCVLLVTVLL